MNNLKEQKCIPCEGGADPLTRERSEKLLSSINGWIPSEDNKKISKEFKFKNFAEAMSFVNRVADLAEAEGHHPDIQINYNKVQLELTTHAIGGLSLNDFILASKIN